MFFIRRIISLALAPSPSLQMFFVILRSHSRSLALYLFDIENKMINTENAMNYKQTYTHKYTPIAYCI